MSRFGARWNFANLIRVASPADQPSSSSSSVARAVLPGPIRSPHALPTQTMSTTPETLSQFERSDQIEQTNTSSAPSPAQDSKRYKCLLVFAGFMAMFQVIGINTSYGVFQQFYTSKESFLPAGTPQSAIAFVGTLGMAPVGGGR